MKLDRSNKYFTIAVYALIVLLACIILVFACINNTIFSFLSHVFRALSPILYGLVFAYLFKPLVSFFDNKVFRFIKPVRVKRLVSILLTLIIALSLISLFLWAVVPQLLSSVSELQYKLGDYIDEANNWIDVHSENASDTLKYIFSLASGALNNILVVISNYLKNALPVVGSFLSGFIAIVGQSLLGLIFSILFLFSYEFFGSIAKKMVMSVFKRDRYARLMETTTNINKSFGGYIRGVILNALIVGIVTFALLAILRVEYAPLISIIMGVANMIPMFGPIIGAIPSALVLLITQPDKLLWFIIIVLAIQAIDGYTVAPKLMGTSIGLSSEWVLISIIVMAGLFGLPGLFIGVPIFAVAYSIIGDFANKRLTKKEMSTDIKDYCSEEDYEIISESFRASLEKKTKKAKA